MQLLIDWLFGKVYYIQLNDWNRDQTFIGWLHNKPQGIYKKVRIRGGL